MAAERTSLRRVAAAVVTGSEPSAALCVAAEEVAALMGAEQGFVFRFEDDRVIVAGVHGLERSPIGASHGMLETGVLPSVVRTRMPARVEDRLRLLGRENSARHWIGPVYRGGIGAPVFVGDHFWGAVVAATTRDERFPAGAEDRLAYFAEIAGIAIGNAEANARLAELAMSDPLTGLANHRAFHSTLIAEVERAGRHRRPVSLAIIDVDHFKRVNDAYGHIAGDRVLIEVARRLTVASRRGDLVARVGGEEFAWIIVETDAGEARRVAERAREAIAGEPFPGVGAVTVSIGVAGSAQAQGASELYRLADAALYVAKRCGRNRSHAHGVDVGPSAPDGDEAGEPGLIRSLTRAMCAKDPALGARCERVARVAERLARASGWPDHEARRLGECALVKDVAMIALSPDALRAAVPLEDEAWTNHTVLGAGILAGVPAPDQVSWVRGHHERWDGGGFPDGLAAAAIPQGARLLALADGWDALTGLGADEPDADAARRIAGEACTRYCPDAVAALEALVLADGHPAA